MKGPLKLNLADYLPYLVNRVGSIIADQFSAETLAPHRLSIATWRVLGMPLLGMFRLLGAVVPSPLLVLLTAAGVRSMSAVGGSAMPCGSMFPEMLARLRESAANAMPAAGMAPALATAETSATKASSMPPPHAVCTAPLVVGKLTGYVPLLLPVPPAT